MNNTETPTTINIDERIKELESQELSYKINIRKAEEAMELTKKKSDEVYWELMRKKELFQNELKGIQMELSYHDHIKTCGPVNLVDPNDAMPKVTRMVGDFWGAWNSGDFARLVRILSGISPICRSYPKYKKIFFDMVNKKLNIK